MCANILWFIAISVLNVLLEKILYIFFTTLSIWVGDRWKAIWCDVWIQIFMMMIPNDMLFNVLSLRLVQTDMQQNTTEKYLLWKIQCNIRGWSLPFANDSCVAIKYTVHYYYNVLGLCSLSIYTMRGTLYNAFLKHWKCDIERRWISWYDIMHELATASGHTLLVQFRMWSSLSFLTTHSSQ